MNKLVKSISVFALYSIVILVLLFAVIKAENEDDSDNLIGTAEDLWGNRVDLDDYQNTTVIISPFSSSNCGYCLIDGYFIEENYFHNNTEQGGKNFYSSLFNPQLDIYTFLKHYRADTTPTITFPTSLHRYHRNGYPYLIGFKDGERLFTEHLSPYDEVWDGLSNMLWSDHSFELRLTSPMKIADNIIGETKNKSLVYVIADGDTSRYNYYNDYSKDKNGTSCIYESELTENDVNKHLTITGIGQEYTYTMLKDQNIPILFDERNYKIGPYSLPKEEYGLMMTIPNPFNKSKYIRFFLRSPSNEQFPYSPWTDFSVWRFNKQINEIEIVLDGRFAKAEDGSWIFAESLTTSYVDLNKFCDKGYCPIPLSNPPKKTIETKISNQKWEDNGSGKLTTLDSKTGRFPSITPMNDGKIAVVWEENGDIVLAIIKENEQPEYHHIEDNRSDSFNPRVTWDGQSLLIVYVNGQRHYYHLYGRFLTEDRLSEEFLINDKGSFDATTPTVISNRKGEAIVTWTEWKANQRFPKYRVISNKTLQPIQDLHIREKGTDRYTNAWFASLIYDNNDRIYGAWNQHYPTTLGVCAGDLQTEATLVTGENIGGYPSLTQDISESYWIFWESSMYATYYENKPQQIRYAISSSNDTIWSIPQPISIDSMTFFNQTPKSCVTSDGSIRVIWSGRSKNPDSDWQIYLSKHENDSWSFPVRISTGNGPNRAPDISVTEDNKVWATWHSGKGDEMTIKVMQLHDR